MPPKVCLHIVCLPKVSEGFYFGENGGSGGGGGGGGGGDGGVQSIRKLRIRGLRISESEFLGDSLLS